MTNSKTPILTARVNFPVTIQERTIVSKVPMTLQDKALTKDFLLESLFSNQEKIIGANSLEILESNRVKRLNEDCCFRFSLYHEKELSIQLGGFKPPDLGAFHSFTDVNAL